MSQSAVSAAAPHSFAFLRGLERLAVSSAFISRIASTLARAYGHRAVIVPAEPIVVCFVHSPRFSPATKVAEAFAREFSERELLLTEDVDVVASGFARSWVESRLHLELGTAEQPCEPPRYHNLVVVISCHARPVVRRDQLVHVGSTRIYTGEEVCPAGAVTLRSVIAPY